jgi:hypothetical protein
MNLKDLVNNLPDLATFPTLGGRSQFSVSKHNNIVEVINSSGRRLVINENHLREVKKRYDQLPVQNRFKASSYTDPNWDNRPSRIFSPYVASIIKSYCK